MSKAEETQKRMLAARQAVQAMAVDKTLWKQSVADAVFELLREATAVTAETLRSRLAAMADSVKTGEVSRQASLVAIARLDELAGMKRDDLD